MVVRGQRPVRRITQAGATSALLPFFEAAREAERIHLTIHVTSRTMCSLACAYSVLFEIPTIRTERGNALTGPPKLIRYDVLAIKFPAVCN